MSTAPLWGEYERLRPSQIDGIKAAAPIAYLPWGSLEWHSYHNPIGLDGLKAHAPCNVMAAETGGVVLPTVFIGTDTIKPYKGFKHTIDHPFETVRTLCAEFLTQLADEGFKVIVLLTGHYGGGQVRAVTEAGDEFAQSNPDIGLWVFAEWQPLVGQFEANHAAIGETSFMLSMEPETVDISELPEDRVATLDQDGVWGEDPRRATAEIGHQQTRALVQVAVPKILSLLENHT